MSSRRGRPAAVEVVDRGTRHSSGDGVGARGGRREEEKEDAQWRAVLATAMGAVPAAQLEEASGSKARGRCRTGHCPEPKSET